MKKFIHSMGDIRLTILIAMLMVANVVLFSCRKDNLAPDPNQGSAPGALATDRSNVNLCILTWNTHILNTPLGVFGGCSGGGCADMAQDIADQIASFDPTGGYDIIAFQEVWQTGASDVLKQLMINQGYPYNRYNHDAGLLTVSRHPITGSTFVKFNDENGILGCANDALKNKGFLYTEIKLEDRCYIHFINTHLDAGDCDDDNSTRIKQLNQLDAWVDALYYSHNPHEAFFLAGDFNMHFSNPASQFTQMMGILNKFSPSFTLAGLAGPGYNAVDYIFIDQMAGVTNVSHQSFDKGPSDHKPVESCMEYSCTTRPNPNTGGGLDGEPCTPGDAPCPPGFKCIGGHCEPL